jgi:dethiobiotin synthetase
MPNFFITGTDTGVGKTWFTAWLVRSWRAQGHDAAALKPISSGDRNDAILLREASGEVLSLDETNPLHFREPAAPLISAREEKRDIDFLSLNRSIRDLAARFSHLAVEGVGGWRVPLAKDYDVREWARELGFPVVVVARAGLGTLNHTLLTVDSIRAAGLTCAGVILNAGLEISIDNPSKPQLGRSVTAVRRTSPDFDLARRTNRALLEDILLLPVLELERGVHAAGKIPVWLGGK